MRTFVIPDIHGNNKLFRKALKEVGLRKSDRLILLGDLIDRGRESKEVLDTIFMLMETGFDIKVIRGNHEQMLLDALADNKTIGFWLVNGGDRTLSSFLTSSIDKIPIKYINFINSLPYYVEVNNCILVHAALNMRTENPFSDIKTMLWERNPEKVANLKWLGNRTIIHGHQPRSQADIEHSIAGGDKILGIDNGTYLQAPGFGSLCIYELETKTPVFVK